MGRYIQHSTLAPVALASVFLGKITPLEANIKERCPACDAQPPDDLERHELAFGRYYCPRCGWEVGQDA